MSEKNMTHFVKILVSGLVLASSSLRTLTNGEATHADRNARPKMTRSTMVGRLSRPFDPCPTRSPSSCRFGVPEAAVYGEEGGGIKAKRVLRTQGGAGFLRFSLTNWRRGATFIELDYGGAFRTSPENCERSFAGIDCLRDVEGTPISVFEVEQGRLAGSICLARAFFRDPRQEQARRPGRNPLI